MVAQKGLYHAATATTAIVGILHLMATPNMLNFNANGAILFFVAGAAQLFWAIPMIKRWSRPWYAVGIGGMAVLIAIYVITKFPGNPITGRAIGVQPNAVMVEVMEAPFIGLAAAILAIESRKMNVHRAETAGA